MLSIVKTTCSKDEYFIGHQKPPINKLLHFSLYSCLTLGVTVDLRMNVKKDVMDIGQGKGGYFANPGNRV